MRITLVYQLKRTDIKHIYRICSFDKKKVIYVVNVKKNLFDRTNGITKNILAVFSSSPTYRKINVIRKCFALPVYVYMYIKTPNRLCFFPLILFVYSKNIN